MYLLLFITAGPMTKLFAGAEEEGSGGSCAILCLSTALRRDSDKLDLGNQLMRLELASLE